MTPPAAAPWRSLFLSSLEKSKASSFSLSSIAHTTTQKAVPRSRTLQFRGFWPLPASSLHHSGFDALKDQKIGVNPDIYESDLLSVTTDVRMKKIGQLQESDDVVEGVFWFEEVSAQWRVRGRAIAIGDPEGDGNKEEKESREIVKRAMRVKKDGEGDQKDWDLERQVSIYFANHSPVMRGTFKNPPPGTPRSEQPSDPQLKLNQKVEDLKDPVARKNFRVLLIAPEEMERLDFSNPDDVRRTNWTLVDGEAGEWKETELWP
ncbi:pyridoxamine 5'-phosphate oxidase-domain-containing protein [Aspergillus filifer]